MANNNFGWGVVNKSFNQYAFEVGKCWGTVKDKSGLTWRPFLQHFQVIYTRGKYYMVGLVSSVPVSVVFELFFFSCIVIFLQIVTLFNGLNIVEAIIWWSRLFLQEVRRTNSDLLLLIDYPCRPVLYCDISSGFPVLHLSSYTFLHFVVRNASSHPQEFVVWYPHRDLFSYLFLVLSRLSWYAGMFLVNIVSKNVPSKFILWLCLVILKLIRVVNPFTHLE